MSLGKSVPQAFEARPGFIARNFLQHPATVGESYLQHLRFATRFCGKLSYAALAALTHALIPSLCETTASRMVRELYVMIDKRH